MATYGVCSMKARKAIKADELLTFAMWCGAIVTGGFMFAASFRLAKEAGEETNSLYLGIFGVYLVFLSIQKVSEMLRKLTFRLTPPAQYPEQKKPEQL